jgi:pyridoxal phosphate enzyme (YggS family)
MISHSQDFEVIVNRFNQVLGRISESAESVHRDPNDVQLVVVTKGHPLQLAQWVIGAGARTLGENYIEEGIKKINALAGKSEVKWHMIGHLQSRKARKMCEHFNVFQALDSIKLALRLDRFAGELGRKLPVFLECNLSGESSKFGFACWDHTLLEEFREEIIVFQELENIIVQGMMTMPPFNQDPEASRPYFRKLRAIKERINGVYPDLPITELSMGMSNDYEIAIQEGATIVRIGQAILGERPPK